MRNPRENGTGRGRITDTHGSVNADLLNTPLR
jgi:hypothetical protein